MATTAELESAFEARGQISKGLLFLSSRVACELVDECRSNFVAVLGIEGFHRLNHGLKPDLDAIADFSSIVETETAWLDAVQASCSEAQNFLAKMALRDNSMLFNLTLANQQ